jgi:hypothetical protein
MSQGIAVNIALGVVHPEHLYIKLKGGSVYRYEHSINIEDAKALRSDIRRAGKRVSLKEWVKVR